MASTRYEALAERIQLAIDSSGPNGEEHDDLIQILQILERAEREGVTDAKALANDIFDYLTASWSTSDGFFERRQQRIDSTPTAF